MGLCYCERVARLRRRVVEAGAEALLVTHPPNFLYLTGFSGSTGALLVEPHRMTLFTDGRYASQAHAEVQGAGVQIHGGPALMAVARRLRKGRKLRVAFEPSRLSVAQKTRLEQAVGSRVRWVALDGAVEDLRSVKSPEEIARMREVAQVGCRVFEEVLPLVKPGVRELELAAEIDYRMRRRGAHGPAFETIVASGARTALPHVRPTEKRLRKNELVVLDLGAILRHYCCDLTRTLYLGRAPARLRHWYAAVRSAQEAACEALRVGVRAAAVDAAARRVLKRYRLDHLFVHSTGHGLGLEVHEEPRLAKGQKRFIQAGNVVTVEPGIYLEGVGGIRVEDDVAVFARGTEVLTAAPRRLFEL